MIEKFSEEELRQIMKELGVKEKSSQKFDVANIERKELKELFNDMPRFAPIDFASDRAYSYINGIISLSLNLLTQKKDGYFKISPSVSLNDEKEYKNMFEEVLEIVKKHNRKWEHDNQ